MRHFLAKKRLVVGSVLLGLTLILTSCGTIIHPERRGQPAGRIDPAIVILDAVGLLFFFIPGVIAFAVDFSNGTIYLPPHESSMNAPSSDVPSFHGEDMRTIRMSGEPLTPERLEKALQEQVGQQIQLNPGTYKATRLNNISDVSPAVIESLRTSPVTNVEFRNDAK